MFRFVLPFIAMLLLSIGSSAIAQDGPSTPVPPVPTQEEMNEYHWARIRELDQLISASLWRQLLILDLLEFDPNGPNAPMLHNALLLERCTMTQLRLQRKWHLEQIGL